METLGFSQIVAGPTHQAGHTLDLIFGAGVAVDLVANNIVPWSDHHALKARLRIPPPLRLGDGRILVCPRRLMESERFLNALRDPMPSGTSLTALVDDWQSRLTAAIDKIAPRRPLRLRLKQAPWYSQELRERKKEVRRLERVWRKTRDEATKTSHRTLMKAYENAVKAAKRDFYAAEIASASSRPAQLFKVIRSLAALEEGRQTIRELELSCVALSSYFADKVLSLRRDLPATIDTVSELEAPWPSRGLVFDGFRRLSVTEVDKLLGSVRATTCPLDPCPSWLLKSGDQRIGGPLREIVNVSLTSGEFPKGLKEAVVRPLLKKPSLDPRNPASYRPVSHFAFLGKVIERAAADQLLGFFDETSALDPYQSGFRPGHGVETVLVALMDDIRRQLDRGGSAIRMLLDLSAAFDVVDHELLVHCLAGAGIRGTALQWLVSFLQNRTQRVAMGESMSSPCELPCGVPQGAILSPTLFF
ncbi:uncharacterized protein LOC143832365 [Paroedura picta]|uniref:uncharacterized protein LOC143832365 n=1 Tax=Paroedura picta TaxID=143630 RepID=UPI004055A11E